MLIAYFWLAYAVSLWCLLRVPTRWLSPAQNAGSSLLLALFGFILWPVFVAAAIKTWRVRAAAAIGKGAGG